MSAGTYELVASFVGFKTVRRRVSIGDGQTVKADIELPAGAIEVGEVKVTADRARFEREVEVSAVRRLGAGVERLALRGRRYQGSRAPMKAYG